MIDCLSVSKTCYDYVATPLGLEELQIAPNPLWWGMLSTVAIGAIHVLGDGLLVSIIVQ